MATAVAGIWNQLSTTHTAATAKPADSASGSRGPSSDSASISANDFLTLLVTEMQNQDPTANTDPNEYINQLVQVNSLEQLISINQTLTGDSAEAGTSSRTNSPSARGPATSMQSADPLVSPQGRAPNPTPGSVTATAVSGNLTIPAANPAAMRVAQALGNH